MVLKYIFIKANTRFVFKTASVFFFFSVNRARTKTVYEIYSRKPVEEVHADIKALGAQYIIMEGSWCTRRAR